MTHKFLSFFNDSFSGLAELLPLLVQVVQRLCAVRATARPSAAHAARSAIFLSAQYVSLIFLVGLPFGFRIGLDPIARRADKIFCPFCERIGGFAQLCRLLIQIIKAFSAALAKHIASALAREQRSDQRDTRAKANSE